MLGLAVEWKRIWQIALLVSLASLMAANCFAAEFGIGLTANDSDRALYLPIQVTNHFRTEISIGFDTAEQKTDSAKIKEDIVEAGIGLFFTQDVYESTLLYYGCRLKYLYAKAELQNSGGSDLSFKQEGYSIAPTLGFEYFLTEHLSLGGEAELYYEHLDAEYDDDPDMDGTSGGTDARVTIRYYF